MPEIVRSMPLTANSVDAETFSQYLEQVADFFNGEPFLFGPTRSVSREASRSLSDESFEAWAFHAFKSEDDDPDPLDAEEEVYTETWGAVDEDGLKDEEQDKVHVNYQIWVAIARPLLDGEYWPDLGEVTNDEQDDYGTVTTIDEDMEEEEDDDEEPSKYFREVWEYHFTSEDIALHKSVRHEYYLNDDCIHSISTGVSSWSLLSEDMDEDTMLNLLEAAMQRTFSSIDVDEIKGIIKKLGFIHQSPGIVG
jgi:hypothetical protein